MTAFLVFYRKEWIEAVRSMRALILFTVCLMLGILSPLLAKMMPDLMRNYKINGIAIHIPQPTAVDAFTQYIHNFSQMGMAAVLLTFAGLLAQELAHGTLIIPLSKGLPRAAIIAAKYAYALSLWSVCFAASAAAQCLYTQMLFHHLPARHVLLLLLCLWLFGAMLPALLLLFSTCVKGPLASLGLSAACIAVFFTGQSFAHWEHWNPLALISGSVGLISGQTHSADVRADVLAACMVTGATLALAMIIFSHRALRDS
ncbi:MAG: ABC transporter permease subunit [Sporolactobacillus sp.]